MTNLVESPNALFSALGECWICQSADLWPVARAEFTMPYADHASLKAYKGYAIWLNRCAACEFMQPAHIPASPEFFNLLYDQPWGEAWMESEFENPCKDKIFHGILRNLARRMPHRGARLLDIGAHAGRFLRLAANAGWRAEGLELNSRSAAFAARKTGLPVYRRSLESGDSSMGPYSAVTLTDVLEHIPNPLAALGNVRGLLRPEGWLAVKVPCGFNQLRKERLRSYLRRDYRAAIAENLVHVNHFSPRSLRLVLERAGFTDIAIGPGAPELHSWRGADHSIDNLIRLSVYGLARLPGGVSSPLALNLQALARRSL